MKIVGTVVIVLSLIVVNGFAATSLDWGSDTALGSASGPDVLDADGVAVPQGSDWYLQLYDTSVAYDPGNRTAGQLASSTDAFAFMEGVALTSISGPKAWAGIVAGTRLFNNSDPNVATGYAVASLTTTLSDLEDPAGATPESTEYNFGTIAQQDWVPEPTTTMLALAGICTVIYRRRRMSK